LYKGERLLYKQIDSCEKIHKIQKNFTQKMSQRGSICIDLGTGVFEWGDGVNIIYKHRLEFNSLVVDGEIVWEYFQVPIDIDSDVPEEPGEEKNLEDYTLPGADDNGIYDEYIGLEYVDEIIVQAFD